MVTSERASRLELVLELLKSRAVRELCRWGWKRIGNLLLHKCSLCGKSRAYYCKNTVYADGAVHRTRF
ncbi:hypothetical protein DdX_13740 [Ditylenchus destructor]|uniref:Uncharacterized protein n=1 Tax=Ditylenchus destructor TaxID=166010 RepID=A0AAD4MTH9_9BILA|nr:hypothetical protein DdX_13740 [Ditylenchus destructor]